MSSENEYKGYFDPTDIEEPTKGDFALLENKLLVLVEVTDPEVRYVDNGGENDGAPYVNFAAVVQEPEEFEGRYAAWDMIMLGSGNLAKVKAMRGYAKQKLDAIMGEDFFATVPTGDEEEAAEFIAEQIEGAVFVARLGVRKPGKKGRAKGYKAKNVIKDYLAADEWGGEGDEEAPF